MNNVEEYEVPFPLREHYSVLYKRCKSERNALRISITMLEQSLREYPDSERFRDQLDSARDRLEEVETHMEQLCGLRLGH